MDPDGTEITQMLNQLRQGDRSVEVRLMERVYPELHRLAGQCWRGERLDHTLQPTALIHETYMLLAGQWSKNWQNRAHFFGVAARIMRRVLVEHARVHQAVKRGGVQHKVAIDEVQLVSPAHSDSFLALDQALMRLAHWDSRQSQVVELRFFGGLTEQETAEVLGVTCRTVQRDWEMARAWLLGEMNPSGA
jgi:RNA polymerase sigma factor (TIGR02999 family)